MGDAPAECRCATPKRLVALVGTAALIGVGVSVGGAMLMKAPEGGWGAAVLAGTSDQAKRNADPDSRQEPLDEAAGIEFFDIEPLLANREHIRVLLGADRIPSLTDPATETIQQAALWLQPGDRVVVVGEGRDAVASPIKVLNWHEIFNMTIGGEPVAVTYCPLCDSASVFSRRVEHEGETMVLEFGASGALYNSNVLMYDRTTKGLWSQVGLQSVSGPLAGTTLRHLPLRMMTFAEFRLRHADGRVVSKETGHTRDYDENPYALYFASPDHLLVPVPDQGDALPRKTLGLGVRAGGKAWFVTIGALAEERVIDTPLGPVRARAGEAGVEVLAAPEGVQTVQTFYYAWSAFHQETEVIALDEERSPPGAPADEQGADQPGG